MQSNRSIPAATVIPVLTYPDVRAAVAFLTAAFGFEERVRIGADHRAQLRLGDGALIVADTGSDRRPPDAAAVTHSVVLRVDDVDAAFDRAVTQGSIVLMTPTDFEYGERQCTVVDPVGHHWTLTQTLRDVRPEQWGGESVGAD